MKRIELIGTSGVGKSTLYNSICRTPINNRSFITVKEALGLAAASEQIPIGRFRIYLYQWILKKGFFRNREVGLARTVLDIPVKEKTLINRTDYERFAISFNIIYRELQYESNPYIVFVRINDFMKKVREFLIIEHTLTRDYVVLFDEGLVHRTYGLSERSYDEYSADDLRQDTALNPAGLILCEQSVDIIFRQIQQRKNRGLFRYTIDHLSEGEIRQFIADDQADIESKVRLFGKMGIPVIRINTGNEPEHNQRIISDFAEGISG